MDKSMRYVGILAIAVFLAMALITAYLKYYLFNYNVARAEGLVLLQSILQFDGVLLGFVGLVVSIMIIRPSGKLAELGSTLFLGFIIFAETMFLVSSAFFSLYGITLLSLRDFLLPYEVSSPIIFMLIGVIMFGYMLVLYMLLIIPKDGMPR